MRVRCAGQRLRRGPQTRERARGRAEGFSATGGSSPTPRPRNSGTGSEVKPPTTNRPADASC